MTIDEIKQALREMKDRCENTIKCSECPFAVGKIKHCLVIDLDGDAVTPCDWPIDLTEADHIDKANATDPLTLNDYQRMARRTAGATRASDIMQEGKHEICVDVGEPCNHEKKYMNKGREIDYDRMTDAAYAAIMAIKLATHVLGCSIEDISKMDLDKYRPRYHGGFDQERSINREE